MSEKASDKPREFVPIQDPLEARGYLKECSRSLASVMIWTKGQKHVFHTHMSVYHEAERILYAAIPPDADAGPFKAELAAAGAPGIDCFFSVSLLRANIFFKTRCVGHDDGGLQFETPQALFKVQRRKEMRLLIPFGRIMRLEITDPSYPEQKLSKKIFDISSSGLSFVANEVESALFHPGAILKEMMFIIGSRRINADGEVRHVKAQPSAAAHPGHKVGVRFSRISAGDAQWIAAFVFEESRKIVTHFL